jgi:RimK family alpha-L-glutamate ligase
MKRIAIAIDRVDWHARRLHAAFLALDMAPIFISLRQVAFAPEGLRFPGFDGLPDGVFVRAIAAGSFEEVTRRLGVLHALAALGVPVWNSAGAIERCVDKSTTAFLLAKAGLPTPETWTVEGREAAAMVMAEAGGEMVLKPLFGAQGRGLVRLAMASDLPPPEAVSGVYHLQRFVAPGKREKFCDYRLLVCRGDIVAAMRRESENWVTNLHRGARACAFDPPPALATLAARAAAAVGADYAGVDLIDTPEAGAMVLEVNSMPGWRGLQSVSEVAIAPALARRLIA